MEESRHHNPSTTLLQEWLSSLIFGEPQAHGGLTLVPLYPSSNSSDRCYRTLAEAIRSGEVTVSEAPNATVPTLRVTNTGSFPVLIVEGEELVGGLQNRVVNTTILIPANSIVALPVSCIEHGRWNPMPPSGGPPRPRPTSPSDTPRSASPLSFETGETAYPRLRRQKMVDVTQSYRRRGQPLADQAAVWDEVADRHRRVGATTRTGAMRDAYTSREANLTLAQKQLPYRADGAVGVVAFVGGTAIAIDIFDHPSTLGAYWRRLVRSYALEAVGARPTAPLLDTARHLLEYARAAHHDIFPSPGLGQDVRLHGEQVVGAALLWDNAVIHTALFRQDEAGPHSSGPRVQRFRR